MLKIYKPKNSTDYRFLASLWSNPKNNRFMRTKKLTVAGVKKRISDKRTYTYILEAEGKKIGTFNIRKLISDAGGQFGIIIDHKSQGKGYGEEAMKLLEKEAKKLGIKKLRLGVFPANKKAINLYKKIGYKKTDVIINMEKLIK